jgi:hypothetical protein
LVIKIEYIILNNVLIYKSKKNVKTYKNSDEMPKTKYLRKDTMRQILSINIVRKKRQTRKYIPNIAFHITSINQKTNETILAIFIMKLPAKFNNFGAWQL